MSAEPNDFASGAPASGTSAGAGENAQAAGTQTDAQSGPENSPDTSPQAALGGNAQANTSPQTASGFADSAGTGKVGHAAPDAMGPACAPPASPVPPTPPVPSVSPHTNPLVRVALYVLAVCSLALGIVGIFVPGLPTTVFVLIAAWAAARSSPRLHDWLRQHKTCGPILRNWEAGGLVSRKSKYTATAVMAASVLIMLLTSMPRVAVAATAVMLAAICIWLWLRPEPPP